VIVFRAGVMRIGVLMAALVVASCAADADVESIEANPVGAGQLDPTEPDEPGPSSGEPDAEEPPGSATGPEPASTIDWASCADAGNTVVELDCATLQVPLDHTDPGGDRIDLALARVPATGSDVIGSLVFNPGGPGASGIDFLASAAVVVPAELAARFDLVAFDPRGVGRSTSLVCDNDLDDEIVLLEEGDDEGWADLVAEAEEFPSTCTDPTLDLAPWVGTNNAARDLDLIRDAVGDEQLSYVGFSYGTRLGATYAELFPGNVRALVLDGGVKPTDDLDELDLGQAEGFDLAFGNFAAACDADDDCALADVGPTRDVYEGLVAEIADEGTFPANDGRVLTPGELQLGVVAALYSTQTWPILADALELADEDQDGSLLQALADTLLGRRPDGTYDNSQVANGFVNCADDPSRPPVGEVREAANEAAARSELFDDLLRADTGCIGAPDPVDPLVIGPAAGSAPILVIGTTGDPATPYEWSVELADSLASAVLFSVEGEGHTAFLSIDCVEPVVVDYLVDLEVPSADSGCSDEAAGDVFPPTGDSELDQLIVFFDCLRDNGADVPELSAADVLADPSGETLLDALDPSDPAFVEAVLACEDLIPGF